MNEHNITQENEGLNNNPTDQTNNDTITLIKYNHKEKVLYKYTYFANGSFNILKLTYGNKDNVNIDNSNYAQDLIDGVTKQ